MTLTYNRSEMRIKQLNNLTLKAALVLQSVKLRLWVESAVMTKNKLFTDTECIKNLSNVSTFFSANISTFFFSSFFTKNESSVSDVIALIF
jgi:hypothetical protein